MRNKRAGTFINFQAIFRGHALILHSILYQCQHFDQNYLNICFLGYYMSILGPEFVFPGGMFIQAGTFILHTRVRKRPI